MHNDDDARVALLTLGLIGEFFCFGVPVGLTLVRAAARSLDCSELKYTFLKARRTPVTSCIFIKQARVYSGIARWEKVNVTPSTSVVGW